MKNKFCLTIISIAFYAAVINASDAQEVKKSNAAATKKNVIYIIAQPATSSKQLPAPSNHLTAFSEQRPAKTSSINLKIALDNYNANPLDQEALKKALDEAQKAKEFLDKNNISSRALDILIIEATKAINQKSFNTVTYPLSTPPVHS